MNKLLIAILLILSSESSRAQSLTEKLLRESPRFSMNFLASYETNLQRASTYQNRQGSNLTFSPRYRINDKYTLIGRVGAAQGLTQENRTEFTNTALRISRRPLSIGNVFDVRPTLSLILPTNDLQREKDALRGALQLAAVGFARTYTNFILGAGTLLRWNNHQFTVSSRTGANIRGMATPFLSLGWSLGKFQILTQNSYSRVLTYRGRQKGRFLFDQSISYIPNRKLSFSIGHTNQGSMLTQDGLASNVRLFDSRSSAVYLGVLVNM